MATTKKQEPVENEIVEEKPVDVWNQFKDMYVPKAPKGEPRTEYVNVNGHIWNIPRNGQVQHLPLPIAEILEMAYKAREEADEYGENMPKEFMPGVFAK